MNFQFSNSHPYEYCVEQSKDASKVIVMTREKCSNCVPLCYGFDTYMVAKPDSKNNFETRSTTWNINDTYDYMYNFKDLYFMKSIISRKSSINWLIYSKKNFFSVFKFTVFSVCIYFILKFDILQGIWKTKYVLKV